MTKKTKFLLVRHASTNWKKFGFLSYTDIDLSEEGKREVQLLSQKLKKYKIDLIFSSPLKRALMTTEEISKIGGLKVRKTKELEEVNFGIFEGLSLEEAEKKYSEIYKKRKENKWNFVIPNGESYSQAYKRVTKFIERLKEMYRGKTIMLVTHATLIKLILMYFTNETLEEVEKRYIRPASCFLISLNGKVKLKNVN